MSDLNKVMLIGRLGDEPQMRYTASGAAIANISVATGRSWTDKASGERVEKTEWHKVVFFGRTAEIVGEYLHKGSHVYIEGRLETEKWEDKDGNDRYTTKIIAENYDGLLMLGTKQDAQPAAAAPEQGGFRDKPVDPAPESAQSGPEDDIPF